MTASYKKPGTGCSHKAISIFLYLSAFRFPARKFLSLMISRLPIGGDQREKQQLCRIAYAVGTPYGRTKVD